MATWNTLFAVAVIFVLVFTNGAFGKVHKSKRSVQGIAVGGQVTVTAIPSANCRSSPVTGSIRSSNPQGTRLNVVGGPQRGSDGYNWWQVSSLACWTREDLLSATSMVPQQPQPPVPQPSGGSYPMYKQCNRPWSPNQLGTCSGVDMCKSGCAVSSVAMLLTKRGKTIDPGQLNTWLKANSGYADGCLIYWGRVDSFGVTRYVGRQAPNEATICAGLAAGKGMIAWVLNRSHFVLLTSCAGGGKVNVNDPYFDTTQYTVYQMNSVIVYD